MKDDEERRFDDLLVWYVNGSLSAEDRVFVADYARRHPEADTEIRRWETVQAAIRDTAPQRAADAGLDKFMHRLRNEQRVAEEASLRGRIAKWLRAWTTPRLSLAIASLIIVAQAGTIAVMLGDRDTTPTEEPSTPTARSRSIEPTSLSAPYLKVRFKPATPAREMNQLLMNIDGSIIAGPIQGGYYAIRLRGGGLDQAALQAGSSGIVDDVIVIGSSTSGQR